MVAHLSDDEIYALNRGGHDPFKVFQAYRAAKKCSDKPTVILAKTVKGYGMGEAGEGQNTTHSQKKLGLEQVAKFAERFDIPVIKEDVKQMLSHISAVFSFVSLVFSIYHFFHAFF
jgi:pyruvate dehydrogenase E1 component